ncbi:MAG: peptide chain release factor N(5)-glutamine methyltransferase [Clostridiales Family XIII bacterium]|jgi:release factor glutamine methyltransferase|nr:peptide chain release factor N(5)-glutamine methyltransferase [Clostridiales Family XIII bacterium]
MGLEIKELIQTATARLTAAGCDAGKRDAEELVCFLLRIDRTRLFVTRSQAIDDKLCDAYFALVDTRAGGRPLQYITGKTEFMGIPFSVDERALIPRQDTETLVETVLAHMERSGNGARRALDIGTGSGAIAVSLCKHSADLKMTATDVSPDALALAKQNAAAAGVAGRIKFVESDMFSALRSGFGGTKYHVIVSNPPYIRSGDIAELQREICEHEPHLALDGGPDGLDAYRVLAGQAHLYLRKGGALFLETGFDQAGAVAWLLEEQGHYAKPETLKDLAGKNRVVAASLL